MHTYRVFSLSVRRYYLDSSNFNVHGAYGGDSMCTLKITHGHSEVHSFNLFLPCLVFTLPSLKRYHNHGIKLSEGVY